MAQEFSRSERMASQIQRELAELVRYGLKDPGLADPSIIEVQVSRDLAYARVYFSLLQAEQSQQCLEALNRASGFLQRELGKRLKARVTPKLSFIYDDTDIRGREMSDLIDSAIASDRRKTDL